MMFKNLLKKRTFFIFGGCFLVIILIASASCRFFTQTKDTSEQDILERLSENAYMQSTNISYILQDNFTTLDTLILFIQSFDNINSPKLYSVLDQVSNSKDYVRVAVADINGDTYSQNIHINISDRDYFKQALKGKHNISDLIISRLDGVPCIVFSAPIYKDNKIIGVVRSVSEQEQLNNLLNSDNFSGNEKVFIIQKDGTVVARLNNNSQISNFYDITNDSNILDPLQKDLQENKNGFFCCDYENTSYHFNYSSIKGSDWYLINALPLTIIEQRAQKSMNRGFLLLIEILSILSIFTFVLIYIISSKNRAINKLAATIENITQHVPGGVFRFNADTLEFDFISEGILSILGYSKELFIQKYQNRFDNFICPSERDMILSTLSLQTKGTSPGSIQYQTENADGQLVWIHNVISLFIDENDKRWYYAVMIDITAYKQFESMLVTKAQNDSLTGLYNKNTAQTLISNHLASKPEGIQALFIVDFDHFKTVNDTFGHPFGDLILEAFSTRLKKMFRSSDILGRIGGDEFVVYMHTCFGATYATEKAELLHGILNDFSLEKNHPFTFSIGIAFYPEHATTFEELFKKADIALYQSKEKGRNCYTVYQKEE